MVINYSRSSVLTQPFRYTQSHTATVRAIKITRMLSSTLKLDATNDRMLHAGSKGRSLGCEKRWQRWESRIPAFHVNPCCSWPFFNNHLSICLAVAPCTKQSKSLWWQTLRLLQERKQQHENGSGNVPCHQQHMLVLHNHSNKSYELLL